jgi:hypothetical protein
MRVGQVRQLERRSQRHKLRVAGIDALTGMVVALGIFDAHSEAER